MVTTYFLFLTTIFAYGITVALSDSFNEISSKLFNLYRLFQIAFLWSYIILDFGLQLRMVHYLFIYNDFNVAEKWIKAQLILLLLAQFVCSFVACLIYACKKKY